MPSIGVSSTSTGTLEARATPMFFTWTDPGQPPSTVTAWPPASVSGASHVPLTGIAARIASEHVERYGDRTPRDRLRVTGYRGMRLIVYELGHAGWPAGKTAVASVR